MDTTDEQLARIMIAQLEANVAWARAEIAAGRDHKDLVEMIDYAATRLGQWRRRLFDGSFGQIAGASR